MDTIIKVGNLVPAPLLAILADLYPNQSPKLTDTDRQIWINVGAASVVQFLQDAHDAAYAETKEPS